MYFDIMICYLISWENYKILISILRIEKLQCGWNWTMFCCSLETQVRIISITSLIVTGLSVLNILKLIITGYVSAILSLFFHDHFISSLFVQLIVFIVHLITYILCLIATIRRNKYMLIPFLIVTVLHIIFFISVSIYFIYLAILLQIAVEITSSDVIANLGYFYNSLIEVEGNFKLKK